ncbi:MAG: hypothetical protein VXW22_09270, partial [Pseudomonadota bacterium]|nr:hypothetical protein [Pseudomonadota bacterium]
MSTTLKVKAVSLMLEAQYIRKRENRALAHARRDVEGSADAKSEYWSLNSHRRYDIRPEARMTHLARAFLAGRPYRSVEVKNRPGKEITLWHAERIAKLINRHVG